jgi:hypothetical protein
LAANNRWCAEKVAAYWKPMIDAGTAEPWMSMQKNVEAGFPRRAARILMEAGINWSWVTPHT